MCFTKVKIIVVHSKDLERTIHNGFPFEELRKFPRHRILRKRGFRVGVHIQAQRFGAYQLIDWCRRYRCHAGLPLAAGKKDYWFVLIVLRFIVMPKLNVWNLLVRRGHWETLHAESTRDFPIGEGLLVSHVNVVHRYLKIFHNREHETVQKAGR